MASAVVALVVAIASVATFTLSPPWLKKRDLQVSVATTRVMVDAPRSWIVGQPPRGADLDLLRRHADLIGNLIASDPLVVRIGLHAGIRPDRIAAVPRITDDVQRSMLEPDSERRANQIRVARDVYRLEFESDRIRPLLNIYAQAPTTTEALRLADASVVAAREYLAAVAARKGTAPGRQVRLRQLGPARGAVVNSASVPQIALLTFLVTWGLCFAAVALVLGARRSWRAAGDDLGRASPLSHVALTADLDRRSRGRARADHNLPTIALIADDWPRTTRIVPWGIAGFLAILWLVPFNSIELTANLPFDLKLDRLVLPLIVAVWVLAWAAGGPLIRLRPTAIHVGVVGFVAAGCLSVVVNASALNRALELDLATKRVVLLVAYLTMFLVVASSVRPTEAPAFLKYMLVLSVLCAFGTVWEYNFHYNVFYDLSQRLAPGVFKVQALAESSAVDQIGRRLTRGPAEHPLEAVAMLSMALPIALVGMIGSSHSRERILYGFAACILFAGAIATYRKSALLVPISVIMALAYFRRGDLIRLAPLGLVMGVVIHVLSPGALGSVLQQLSPSRLGVSTVNDRAADYDAVRPDAWSHLLFGRGFGSYDHVSYRILDSDVLGRLVDSGVVGLLASVLMVLSIVLVARAPIRNRSVLSGPVSLVGAVAAIAYLVASTLFDATAYPHTPYILLVFAALVAVVAGRSSSESIGVPPVPDAAGGRLAQGRPATGRASGSGHLGHGRLRPGSEPERPSSPVSSSVPRRPSG